MVHSVADEQASQPAADVAYAQIKQAIITGTLAPGGKVSEPALAQSMGVSRTPVHQAIVRLQSEKWLEVSSRRGILIAPLDAAELREVYEVLIGLEGLAVASLAARPSQDESVDLDIAAAAQRCENALAAKDLRLWAEADNSFHNMLLERSGNFTLCRVAAPMVEHAHRARLLTVNLRPWPTTSNEDHARIVGGIRRRDPQEARAALDHHRRRGIATLVPILQAFVPAAAFAFTPIRPRVEATA